MSIFRRRWRPPELRSGDQLVETEVVEANGRRTPITMIMRRSPHGGWSGEGFSRSLDLPPGASAVIPVDVAPEGQ